MLSNFLVSDDLVILNLLLQITVLSSAAVSLALILRRKAAVVYCLLFPALISLVLLTLTSLTSQFSGWGLYQVAVDLPVRLNYPQETANSSSVLANTVTEQVTRFNSVEPDRPTPVDYKEQSGPAAFLFVVWITGTAIFIFRLLHGLFKIDSLIGSSKKPGIGARQRIAAIKIPHFAETLKIREQRDIESPVLVGIIRPVLLFPTGLIEHLSNVELRAVLLHEIAHYRRRDSIQYLLQNLAVAVFWFHPLVLFMDRMISRAREEVCDNYVLQQANAIDYGQALLRVTQFLQSKSPCATGAGIHPTVAIGIAGRHWKLEQRIHELLDTRRETAMHLRPNLNRAIQIVMVAVAILLGTVRVSQAQNSTESTESTVDSNIGDTVEVVSPARREQLEQQALELDLQAQQLDSSAAELEREMRNMQSQGQRMQREMQVQVEQQRQQLEIQARQMNQAKAELQQQMQIVRQQRQEMEQELRNERRLVQRELQEARETVRQEFRKEDFSAEIASAITELRQSLAELDQREPSTGGDDLIIDVDALSRSALMSALQSLEALDVEALETQIMEQIEISLQDVELDTALDIDIEYDVAPETEIPPPVQSEPQALTVPERESRANDSEIIQ